jgi:hypothetical protein
LDERVMGGMFDHRFGNRADDHRRRLNECLRAEYIAGAEEE